MRLLNGWNCPFKKSIDGSGIALEIVVALQGAAGSAERTEFTCLLIIRFNLDATCHADLR